MVKAEIAAALQLHHQEFCNSIQLLDPTAFAFKHKGKWNAGQQLEHIVLSVRPLTLALSLPKIVLKLWLGKANRKSRMYEELVAKYKNKLQTGGAASGRFVPKEIAFEQRSKKITALMHHISKLMQKTERFSETEFDTYILPHPLLGKLTLKEMLYFTIYHVQHHHQQVTSSQLEMATAQTSAMH